MGVISAADTQAVNRLLESLGHATAVGDAARAALDAVRAAFRLDLRLVTGRSMPPSA